MGRVSGTFAGMMATIIPLCAGYADTPTMPIRCYDIRVETLMPHLEENLRYATTQEVQCVTRHDLHALFPVLNHPALAGCRLGRETQHEQEGLESELECKPDHGTRGRAKWSTWNELETGELTVQLGGKNMTFSQRITARLKPSPQDVRGP